MINFNRFVIDYNNMNERIDKFVALRFPDVSRTHIQKLIAEEYILVNNGTVKSNYKLNLGDEITVQIPKAIEPEIQAEDIPLDVLFEDDDIIVINKPKQMVVHPARGHYTGTLVNALLYHCKDNLSGINGIMRPGIVHRIDMDTTGVLVVAKNDYAHNKLAEQLKVHSISRIYEAIVHNVIYEDEGTVDAKIGRHPNNRLKMEANVNDGKDAITHYKVLERFRNYTYIECMLETGRTHQIRVHMSSIGYPLLGDTIYGPSKSPFHLTGQTLHARLLGFVHPRTGQYMEFSAPRPEYFTHLLEILPK
ncbi:MAG: RluA family pseudouridine synthase [Lachnospiraceae bacterium]|nr:RluA family pseudouridine synthase [Lachnospiraceae bacterium]